MNTFARLAGFGRDDRIRWRLRPSARFEPQHPDYIWGTSGAEQQATEVARPRLVPLGDRPTAPQRKSATAMPPRAAGHQSTTAEPERASPRSLATDEPPRAVRVELASSAWPRNPEPPPREEMFVPSERAPSEVQPTPSPIGVREAVLDALDERGLAPRTSRLEAGAAMAPRRDLRRTVVSIAPSHVVAAAGEVHVHIDRVQILPPELPRPVEPAAPATPPAASQLAAFLEERNGATR